MTHHLGGPDKVLDLTVTEQESTAFDDRWKASQGTADCCELSQYRILLLGTPASCWNKSAARVMARHLASEMKYEETDYEGQKALEDAVMVHIRTLFRQRHEKQKSEGDREIKRKRDAKASRKQTVSLPSSSISM